MSEQKLPALGVIAVLREIVPNRRKITKQEMVTLLVSLPIHLVEASTITGRDAQGRLYVGGKWAEQSPGAEKLATAEAWADMCKGITCVSVLPTSYYVGDELREGLGVRHDEPGSMHPHHRAVVMFVPESLADKRYVRGKAARVLVVS